MLSQEHIQFFNEVGRCMPAGYNCSVSSAQFIMRAGPATLTVEPRGENIFDVSAAYRNGVEMFNVCTSNPSELARRLQETAMRTGAIVPLSDAAIPAKQVTATAAGPSSHSSVSLGEAIADLGIEVTAEQALALLTVEAALAKQGAVVSVDVRH